MAYQKRIVHNLEESPYSVETKDFIFYFSREFNVNKFEEQVFTNRKDQRYKLKAMFGVDVDLDCYFDLSLYSQIEKLGFLVKDKQKGVTYKCLDIILLSGKIVTLNELNELLETTTRD